MKIVFVCHVEYDLRNKFGAAKGIDDSQQTFYHIIDLFKFIEVLKIPVTLSFMVGNRVEDNLLKFLELNKDRIPAICEKAIHLHQGDFSDSEQEKKIKHYFQIFEKVFNETPHSIVFGKWQIRERQIPFLRKLGIARDGSWVPKFRDEEYIIKPPFYFNNILEIPPLSDGKNAISPFARLSHFFLLRRIIQKYSQENFLLHIPFHSYDLFDFRDEPKLRFAKKFIFQDILKLVKKNKLEVLNFSDVSISDFKKLEKINWPLLSRMFNFINH